MLLKDYLDRNEIKVTTFAEHVGVTTSAMYSYLQNPLKDMRLSIAFAIEKATSGSVTCQDLAPNATRKNKNGVDNN